MVIPARVDTPAMRPLSVRKRRRDVWFAFEVFSLSPEQREELAGLMANALDDAGLAAEMARLADALRSRRPELDRPDMAGGVQMSGSEPLGLGDATTALAELADLAELESALGQDYPGPSLDDIAEESGRDLHP